MYYDRMKETVSQTWRRAHDERQHELTSHTADVEVFMQDYNAELSALVDSGASSHDIMTRVAEIVTTLDGMWPFHNHLMQVSGTWLAPSFSASSGINGFSINCQSTEEEVCREAVSLGIGVHGSLSDPEKPTLGFLFGNPDQSVVAGVLPSYSWGSVEFHYNVTYFAHPGEATLHNVAYDDLPSTDIAEVKSRIMTAESIFQLYTRHKSSGFYKFSSNKQLDTLARLAENVEETLPAPTASEQLAVTALAHTLYKISDDETLVAYKSSENAPLPVEGRVTGVVSLETLVTKAMKDRIRSSSDLICPEAGIALAVDITPEERGDSEDRAKYSVYLPYNMKHPELNLSLTDKYIS